MAAATLLAPWSLWRSATVAAAAPSGGASRKAANGGRCSSTVNGASEHVTGDVGDCDGPECPTPSVLCAGANGGHHG